MAKFNIKSIVLSIADEAIDKDFDIIAENILPITRIYKTFSRLVLAKKKIISLTILEKSVVLISISAQRLCRSIRSSCDVPDVCRSWIVDN
jgi:hypothetical protein